MSVANDFQPVAIGIGANVESQATYLTDPALSLGQQPGIASSAFNNKAIRQASFVASSLAQFIANQTGVSASDNGVSAQFLAQLQAAIQIMPPVINAYTATGAGTWNATYYFFISQYTVAPTAGATYTNNGVTYTVSVTVTGTVFQATGNGAPTTSGTLTKASGTGDSTITFYSVRAPLFLKVTLVGGGGAGAGSTSSGAATTFGTALLSAGGGAYGTGSTDTGGAGGTSSLGSGPTGVALTGAAGGTASDAVLIAGGAGGSSVFGGAGGGGFAGASPSNGGSAAANTGSGGGGLGSSTSVAGSSGGGAGGFVCAFITTVLSTYAFVIGTGGTGGSGGGSGGSGVAFVEEYFQ
jgi:hypothetical protein